MRALGRLVAHDVGHLLPALLVEQPLEAARAVGVGSLADDQKRGILRVRHRAEERRRAGRELRRAHRALGAAHPLGDGPHMLIGRAAAAAHDAHAVLADECRERFRQPVRGQVVDRLAVLDARQPRVGRAEQRERRVLGQKAQRLVHQLRPGRAVQPDAGQPQRRKRGQRRADLAADQHLPRRLDRHGCEDWRVQPALRQRVAAGQNRRLALQQVVDGLHQQRVHLAVEQTARLLEIGRVQRVEANLPQAGQLRAGADRADREARGVGCAESVGGGAGVAGGGRVDLARAPGEVVFGEGDGGSAECVGQHRIRARLQVGGVQRLNRLRAAEVEHLVAAFEAVEIGERQVHRLDAGARRAVEHDRALGGGGEQAGAGHVLILVSARRGPPPRCVIRNTRRYKAGGHRRWSCWSGCSGLFRFGRGVQGRFRLAFYLVGGDFAWSGVGRGCSDLFRFGQGWSRCAAASQAARGRFPLGGGNDEKGGRGWREKGAGVAKRLSGGAGS